ncbi:MAG: 8-amino-7-oxononanoate synthase [Acidobacteria bacterium]|nr:8-amino-7-oxononanoate synthase [Acidobacteriota bacterium]
MSVINQQDQSRARKQQGADAPDAFLRETLEARKRAGLARKLRQLRGAPGPRVTLNGRDVLLLCSNNYLGLAADPRMKEAAQQAINKYGCGATGSRLISGNLEPYQELEHALALFKATEAALVFSSGYQTNLGTVSALVNERDAIFSDELNHASLIDGSRLSRAEINVYRHCDPSDLEQKLASRASARRKLILTESVFSMDGDLAPLRDIAFLAKKYNALLMVDEAHATGVFGPTGAGLVEALGIRDQVHVQMGTFSKALASLGGYVAGSKELIDYLLQHARSFIFTTGLPPSVLAASQAALEIVRNEPQRREALWRNVHQLRSGLERLGFDAGPEQSQIIPLRIGDSRLTMAACRLLLKDGIFAQGIRPPTVPPGTARLRLAPMATHTADDLQDALAAFAKLYSALQARKATPPHRLPLQPASVAVSGER